MKYFTLPVSFLLMLILFSCKKDNTNVQPGPYLLQKNIQYGLDSQQDMDIYLSTHIYTSYTPVVLLLHGGGWNGGDKSNFDGLGVYEAFTQNGYAVVNMNYRLDDRYKYPAPLNDVEAAIAFLQSKQECWHIDPSRICILGRSAGANIALEYAYTRNEKGTIKAVVDIFGPTDLTDATILTKHLAVPAANYMGIPFTAAPQLWQSASPIFHLNGAVPTIIFQGTDDKTVFPIESLRLNDSLLMHNIPTKLVIWPGQGHGFPLDVWQSTAQQAVQWVRTFM